MTHVRKVTSKLRAKNYTKREDPGKEVDIYILPLYIILISAKHSELELPKYPF